MTVLAKLSTSQILSIHNIIAQRAGKPPVKRFADRATAEERTRNITRGIHRKAIIQAFEEAKIAPELIALIPQAPATVSEPPSAPPSLPVEKAPAKASGKAAPAPSSTLGKGKPQPEPAKAPADLPVAKGTAKGKKSPESKITITVTTPSPVPTSKGKKSQAASAKPPVPENPVLAEAKKKEHARQLEEEKKQEEEVRKERRRMPAEAAAVLRCLQESISPEAIGEHAQMTSTALAKKLETSTTVVCRAVECLDRLNLVGFEDDSPDDANRFFYVSLTDDGRALDLDKEPGGAVPKGKKLPGEAPGPRSNNKGKKIYKLTKENPRREGTHGWKSWERLKDGMTFEGYREAGGRPNDLQWDVDHKFVEVR